MPFVKKIILHSKISLKLNTPLFFWGMIFLLFISTCHAYDVAFQGIENPDTLKLVESASQLEKLKDSPPATLLGLNRRAEGDMEHIILALHSLAYYNAKAQFKILDNGSKIIVQIETGPVYPLAAFTVRYWQNDQPITPTCEISLEDLHVVIGAPALPETILAAEDLILDKLNLCGYAFASIKKRDAVANQALKNVAVIVDVETGPLTYFGPLNIKGLDRVKEGFLYKKLRWCEGDLYDPKKIEQTQEALEVAGLFRSINFTHAEEAVDGNILPLDVTLLEGKQRSIGYGISYTSEFGPGISGEWEDRNIHGLGEKFSVRANLWAKLQEGTFSYLIPDYKRQNQNLIWQVDYNHEQTKPFTESALSLSATIERKWNEHLRFSYGLMYKLLRSTRSENNGTFDLIKTPLQLRWSNANSLLDPTEGASVQLKVTPSFQFLHPQFVYCINALTGSYYLPLTEDHRHVFALKLMLGSIFGSSEHEIPPPERLYAGSENALRGYKFLTVCPIEKWHHHKPVGGRSLFVYSLEMRHRIGENFGFVTFYEIGNVYKRWYPELSDGLRQSAGVGLRYHTPIGPLRLDFAVPLNRRKHIDNAFEAYFSIGQSF